MHGCLMLALQMNWTTPSLLLLKRNLIWLRRSLMQVGKTPPIGVHVDWTLLLGQASTCTLSRPPFPHGRLLPQLYFWIPGHLGQRDVIILSTLSWDIWRLNWLGPPKAIGLRRVCNFLLLLDDCAAEEEVADKRRTAKIAIIWVVFWMSFIFGLVVVVCTVL